MKLGDRKLADIFIHMNLIMLKNIVFLFYYSPMFSEICMRIYMRGELSRNMIQLNLVGFQDCNYLKSIIKYFIKT